MYGLTADVNSFHKVVSNLFRWSNPIKYFGFLSTDLLNSINNVVLNHLM